MFVVLLFESSSHFPDYQFFRFPGDYVCLLFDAASQLGGLLDTPSCATLFVPQMRDGRFGVNLVCMGVS